MQPALNSLQRRAASALSMAHLTAGEIACVCGSACYSRRVSSASRRSRRILMRLSLAVGVASLLLVVAVGLDASGQGKDKKFEVPKNAIAGTVKSVDLKASSFMISVKK